MMYINVSTHSFTVHSAGTCRYRNQTVEDMDIMTFEYPCELWRCNVTAKTITVIGFVIYILTVCRKPSGNTAGVNLL